MAWLTVLGTGTWGFADSSRRMRSFPAGVHEVDDETVEFARLAHSPLLVITDVEPAIVRRDPSPGPLSWEDIRLPADGSVMLAQPEVIEAAHEADPYSLPLEYPCGVCNRKFPSAPSRDRHREFHHGVNEPEPAPEPELPLDAAAAPEILRQMPQGVHPHEVEVEPGS